jgi:DNA adenine methylase
MKISAIAPWFGAKRVLASRIVAEFGPHKAYWEPMCGSLAVLLSKPEASQETVSDMHGGIHCLARVLAHGHACSVLYGRLSRTLASEQLFLDSVALIRDAPVPDVADVDYAYHFFVSSWLGRNGVAGTASYNQGFCVRYTSNGGIQGTRFAAAVDSIPDWHRRLREVTILRRDVFDLLPRIDDAFGTVLYLDPPYIEKGAAYIHDFELSDHERLAEMLGRFKRTRICVSYYAHQYLKILYPGWTVVAFDVTKALVNQGARDKRADKVLAPEVLLINGPSLTVSGGLF